VHKPHFRIKMTFHNATNGQSTGTNVKRQYTCNNVKFCNCCKKLKHVISECRMRMFNEEEKN